MSAGKKRDWDGREYVEIRGVKVYIGSEAECEGAAFVVCSPVSYFPDDVHTTCSACKAPIVHRPHAPQRPPKLCIDCARLMMQAEINGPQ